MSSGTSAAAAPGAASPTVLQVGEGRFLRAFLGVLVAEAKARGEFRARLVLTAPRPSGSDRLADLRARGGRYRVVVRGPEGERSERIAPYDRIVDGFTETADLLAEIASPVPLVVVSNTTEAGLAHVPEGPAHPRSYPARLTAWLDLRRRAGLADPVAVVPCELLADNARVLEAAVRAHADAWGLPVQELLAPVSFVETLVDRIVTSEDPDDPFACFTEPYLAFYLGGAPRWLRDVLPLDERHVHWVDDVTVVADRKVRLLNGLHSLMAVVGLQMGVETVAGALDHADLGRFLRSALRDEGVGSFPAAEREAADAFASDTLSRLRNPGVRDTLSRLTLQISAKVRARWTPILEGCRREQGRYPERFAFGVAAYLRLAVTGQHAGVDLAEVDDAAWVGRLRALWSTEGAGAFVAAAAREPGWPAPADRDLVAMVAAAFERASRDGIAAGVRALP